LPCPLEEDFLPLRQSTLEEGLKAIRLPLWTESDLANDLIFFLALESILLGVVNVGISPPLTPSFVSVFSSPPTFSVTKLVSESVFSISSPSDLNEGKS